MASYSQVSGCVDVCSPIRNRYFYGKLLDVFHFEMEQNYFNSKRWLMNRLVTGYGVVCGLNVQLGSDNQSLIVTPGVAIDRCGHEIMVCQPTDPISLPTPPPATPAPPPSSPPPATGGSGGAPGTSPAGANNPQNASPATNGPMGSGNSDCCDSGSYYYLSICYHECQTDPSPALGGDCDTQATCAPGAIRERYRLQLVEGKLCPASNTSRLQDVISGGVINYGALANYVTNTPCSNPCDDCCIGLANIHIPAAGQSFSANSIDITVRPIVYTNDLLYDLMTAWMNQTQPQARGAKP